jgi:hypothetical protein
MVSPTYIVFQELAFVPKLMGQMGRVTKVTDVYVIIAKVTEVYVIMAQSNRSVCYYGHSTSNLT